MWIFATKNPHKLLEVQAIFGDALGLRALPGGLPTAPEVGQTLYENALQKAEFYYARVGGPLLVEDSGLFVPALGGLPGVHSATYGGPMRLLEAMRGVSRRQAYFVAVVLAYLGPGRYYFFLGHWAGAIAWEARGETGFGYDPVFIPKGQSQTVAELGPAYKQQHSHRSQAFRKFAAWHIGWASRAAAPLGKPIS